MTRSSIARAVAVVLVVVLPLVVEGRPAAGGAGQSAVHALLDVPYVSQTPELCGGAAVAMVLRYWGERDVAPQDFARLVVAGDGGILTNALTSAVRDRGWQALVVPTADGAARGRIRSEVDQGRPLIALIEVAPRVYHYVVIVGATDEDVVVHDPARAPYRVLHWADFDRAWTATGRWLLLVLPPGGIRAGGDVARTTTAPAAEDTTIPAVETPCTALVERSVQLALAGDGAGAEQGLIAATQLCPNDSAPWRELAGLRFSQSRWSDARDLAGSAVRLAPDDAYAWQLVATSRYLTGDAIGALAAWNRGGEPGIDSIEIHGAERTRHPVVVRASGLALKQVLTPESFGRAIRRLRDLPAAANARLAYQPVAGGLARVEVVVDERKVLPSGWPALAIRAARDVLRNEVRVDAGSLLGAGDLESVAWRWSAPRRRVALGFAVPSPAWLPGIVSIEGQWEQQTYATASSSADGAPGREARRRVGVQLADWPTSWLRWQAGAARDHFREYRELDAGRAAAADYLAVESTGDVRLAHDRLALAVSAGWWTPLDRGRRFATGGLLVAWRSTADPTVPSWSAVTEFAATSRVAPLALWPGAGTGQGRTGLLRAHPLLKDGVVTGALIGRDMARSSMEYVRPVGHVLTGSLAVAGFVDTARAWRRTGGLATSPLYVDAGAGIRVRAPGSGGVVRLDIARGLRGGGTQLSAGWIGTWPR